MDRDLLAIAAGVLLSLSRSNRQRSCNEAEIGKVIAVLGLDRSMARMLCFYRLGGE